MHQKVLANPVDPSLSTVMFHVITISEKGNVTSRLFTISLQLTRHVRSEHFKARRINAGVYTFGHILIPVISAMPTSTFKRYQGYCTTGLTNLKWNLGKLN